MEELVAEADEVLSWLAPKQSRYKVANRPDARTIRYYVTQKLLPGPTSYNGGRARYSGAHLIRLLLIKKMQAEHHTLKQVSKVLEGAGDSEVVAALYGSGSTDLPEPASKLRNRQAVTFERYPLPHGGSIDLPEDALRSRSRRRELAESLEALARSLREDAERQETDAEEL